MIRRPRVLTAWCCSCRRRLCWPHWHRRRQRREYPADKRAGKMHSAGSAAAAMAAWDSTGNGAMARRPFRDRVRACLSADQGPQALWWRGCGPDVSACDDGTISIYIRIPPSSNHGCGTCMHRPARPASARGMAFPWGKRGRLGGPGCQRQASQVQVRWGCALQVKGLQGQLTLWCMDCHGAQMFLVLVTRVWFGAGSVSWGQI